MTPDARPAFRFLRHFDYGLLREVPGSLQYDMLQNDGSWHRIRMNPFTASMSEIGGSYVRELAGGADLYGPIATVETADGVVPFEDWLAASQ
jgi:hypothetical protein